MNRGVITAIGILVSCARVFSDEEKTSIRIVDTDKVEVSWNGVSEKTYFMQWSTNLVDWGYMPMISIGAGSPLALGFESDADKFFVRLLMPSKQVLDPKGADFDNDGLTNWQEVSEWGTDPFVTDTDGDGFADGQDDSDFDGISDQWERMVAIQLGDPTIVGINDIDESTDSDGDGVKDLLEYQVGLSAHKTDSDGDGYSDLLSIGQNLILELDEESGIVADDASSKQLDGFLVDSPVWQPTDGIAGGNLRFTGGNDAVTLSASALNSEVDISVSLWFKTDSQSTTQALLSGANSGQSLEFAVLLEQNTLVADRIKVDAGAGESFIWTRDRSLADGLWHHLAIVRDAGNSSITLYLDGKEVGSQSFAVQPVALQIEALTLGQKHSSVSSYEAAAAFVGEMDEVRVYSALLSDDSASELFRPNDLDADGLPDDYEVAKTGNLSTLVGADDDLDGDGLTNRDEFESGSDPLDYYNGQTPVVTFVSDNTQTIFNGQRTPEPLVFKVTEDGSTPLVGAPVTLEHLGLLGSVKTLDGKTLSSSIILKTDSNGEVSVYFKAD